MVNLIVVDLTKPEEVDKLASLNGGDSREALEKHISEGRTIIIFDLKSGDIVMALQKGELLYLSNENVTFKSII